MDAQPAIAAIRFGLGRRPAEPVPADPVAWLDSQLATDLPAPTLPEGLPVTMADIMAAIAEDQRSVREGNGRPNVGRQTRGEITTLFAFQIETPNGFRERLVTFWANHFTVARQKVGYYAGHFVREAIRPHVTGSFADMLVAVTRHPAMLSYLDNSSSVGPNSRAGKRNSRGLNENLAREILELHTVSPAAGYTQADVTAFAKVLTGWSFAARGDAQGFLFREVAHEPGAKTVMGRSFPEGLEGGMQALAWLGRHPATYHHLATKLVRHFVADTPPPTAVARIEAILKDTNGDLAAASRGLVRLPEAWNEPLSKVRTPNDYVLAVLRALEAPADTAERIDGMMRYLGQPVWSARAPNGWPDVASEWAAPESMVRRIEWANGIARRGSGLDASGLAEAVLGPLCRRETLQAAARAGSAREALTLVLTSPEFQRR